mgnify:CR=1 FL=1
MLYTIKVVDVVTLVVAAEDEDDDGDDDDEEDDEDNEGLSSVTVEAVKKAKDDYEKYKASLDEDSDEEEEVKPALTLGEQVTDALDNFVQTLSGTSKEKQEKTNTTKGLTKDSSPIVFEKEVKKVEKEPSLKEDSVLSIQTEKSDTGEEESFSLDGKNISNSEKKKTIQINQ